jgi:hypothetical protein
MNIFPPWKVVHSDYCRPFYWLIYLLYLILHVITICFNCNCMYLWFFVNFINSDIYNLLLCLTISTSMVLYLFRIYGMWINYIISPEHKSGTLQLEPTFSVSMIELKHNLKYINIFEEAAFSLRADFTPLSSNYFEDIKYLIWDLSSSSSSFCFCCLRPFWIWPEDD